MTQVNATQADREAAAATYNRLSSIHSRVNCQWEHTNYLAEQFARYRLAALSTFEDERPSIVLVSTTSGAGFETHGLFTSMDDALAHVSKDEGREVQWERGDRTRKELRFGRTYWSASIQPIRARISTTAPDRP